MNENESLLDKAGAAALLSVSVRTVESWVSQRRIPYVKLGEGRRGALRFRPAALREWIAAQEISPQGGAAREAEATPGH